MEILRFSDIEYPYLASQREIHCHVYINNAFAEL